MKNYRNTERFKTRQEIKKVLASRLGKLIEKKIDVNKGDQRQTLADQIHYSKSMINKWCSEKSEEFPSLNALLRLKKILGCSIDYLLDEDVSAPDPVVASVCDQTGLSAEAVEKLISRKDEFSDYSKKHFLDFLILDDNLIDAINRYCFIARNNKLELTIPTHDQAIKSKSLPEGYVLIDDRNKSKASNIHRVKTDQAVVVNGYRIDDLLEETAMTIVRKCLDKLKDRLNEEYSDQVSQIDERYL